MLGSKSEDRYGKIAFQGYRAREKSVERVMSASRSRAGRRFVERVLDLSSRSALLPPPCLRQRGGWATLVARHGSALLVHWKCEVEELNRISTSMPWKQA